MFRYGHFFTKNAKEGNVVRGLRLFTRGEGVSLPFDERPLLQGDPPEGDPLERTRDQTGSNIIHP